MGLVFWVLDLECPEEETSVDDVVEVEVDGEVDVMAPPSTLSFNIVLRSGVPAVKLCQSVESPVSRYLIVLTGAC